MKVKLMKNSLQKPPAYLLQAREKSDMLAVIAWPNLGTVYVVVYSLLSLFLEKKGK